MGQEDQYTSYASPVRDDNNFKNEFMASENFPRHRQMNRVLPALTLLLCLGLVAGDQSFYWPSSYGYGDQCKSQGCLDAADRINRYTDPSVDPCDDFYQFACGGWQRENTIPPGDTKFTTYGELMAKLKFAVRDVLKEGKKASDPGYIKKIKDFYSSCVNQDYNRDDFQDLKDVIQTRFGGWPLVSSNWDESSFELEDAALEATRLGVHALVNLYVIPNFRNSTKHQLVANQPSLFTLGYKDSYRGFDRDDPKFLALEDRIVETARMFGSIDEASAREDAVALVTFERDLALKVYLTNYLYEYVVSKWRLDFSTEAFDWGIFFYYALANPDVGIYDFRDDEVIYGGSDVVFTRIRDLLLVTPKRTVANYIVWRVIDTYWDIASNSQTDEELNQSGVTAAREKECLESVTTGSDFGLASSQIFINEKFSPLDKNLVMKMIPQVKEAAKELMDDLDWIDEDTRKMTKEKLDYMKERVGYPEEIYNDAYLENYYSNVSYTSNNYLKNVFILKRDSWMKTARKLRVPNDGWRFLPIIVTGYYELSRNTIELPASLFHPAYFSGQGPRSLNYGALGSVIGFGLTSGFDKTGIRYDKYGTYESWWSSSAVESLNNQAQCLVEQYNNFFMVEANMTLNGQWPLDSNMDDNAGVRQSFRAYRNWVESECKEEPAIPGLSYSHDQLFFIGYSHLYCELRTKEEAVQTLTSQTPFTPGRFRVNGPFQNSEDFARTFNCPLNSKMNPAKKCVVW